MNETPDDAGSAGASRNAHADASASDDDVVEVAGAPDLSRNMPDASAASAEEPEDFDEMDASDADMDDAAGDVNEEAPGFYKQATIMETRIAAQ